MAGARNTRAVTRALGAAAAGALLALGCAGSGAAPDDPAAGAPEPGFTRCVEPRHPMCTRDYRPVCAQTPDGWKTYPNACSACADPAVAGHKPGECPAS